MLRYEANNPYGFTYVQAEEVTDVDLGTLALWNQYNSEFSGYIGKVLLSGEKLNEDEIKRFRYTSHQLDSLSVEIQKQKVVR